MIGFVLTALLALACPSCLARDGLQGAGDPTLHITAHMDPPRWAVLERQLLADNVPACREFFNKYFDDRGYLQVFVRWGANDGPDDAFENFNHWPELHALGAGDDILQMYLKGHEGLLARVHDERAVLHDRLADRPAAQQQDVEGAGASILTRAPLDAKRVAGAEDCELA